MHEAQKSVPTIPYSRMTIIYEGIAMHQAKIEDEKHKDRQAQPRSHNSGQKEKTSNRTSWYWRVKNSTAPEDIEKFQRHLDNQKKHRIKSKKSQRPSWYARYKDSNDPVKQESFRRYQANVKKAQAKY